MFIRRALSFELIVKLRPSPDDIPPLILSCPLMNLNDTCQEMSTRLINHSREKIKLLFDFPSPQTKAR